MKTAIIALCCTCFLIESPIQCFESGANSFDTSERASCAFNRCECFSYRDRCYFKTIIADVGFQTLFLKRQPAGKRSNFFRALLRGKTNLWGNYFTVLQCSCWTEAQHDGVGIVGNVPLCSHRAAPARSRVAGFWGVCSTFTGDCRIKTNTTALYVNLLIRYSRFENSSLSGLSLSHYFSMSQSKVRFWNSVKFLALFEQGCHATPWTWHHLLDSFKDNFLQQEAHGKFIKSMKVMNIT